MDIIQILIKELEHESLTTRKMVALVPEEKFGWKPHEKSMGMKQLAVHIAELPSWVKMVLETDELDFAKSPYTPAPVENADGLLWYFEKCLAEGRESFPKATESVLQDTWILRDGEMIFSKSSKYEMIRMVFSQIVHHRAQLGVYLRLNNIPIPGSYGPSADEQG